MGCKSIHFWIQGGGPLSPAPVVAAAAPVIAEKGPTWSSELRSWLPSLIIGLVVIIAIIGGLIFAVGYAVNWLDGSCEEDGYDTLAGCALGGTVGNVLGSTAGAFFALTPPGIIFNAIAPVRIDGSGATYQGSLGRRIFRKVFKWNY